MRDDRDRGVWILIGLGLALRLYAAFSHLDLHHPDEHFQTLEPASRAVFGLGWKPWEWEQGARSWFVPALYIPLLEAFKFLGIRGGPYPIMACRAMMAAASAFGLWQFWSLLLCAGFRRASSLAALAAFSLAPAMASWGAATLSDNWAMIFLCWALARTLLAIERKGSLMSAGALWGLTFLARIQMGAFAVGAACVLYFWKGPPRRQLHRFLLGGALVLAFQGLLDWGTWGSPFHSVVENVRMNLLEGKASSFGTLPVYAYFRLIPENLGWPLSVLAAGAAAAGAILGAARLRPQDGLVGAPALLYFLAHCAIAHKEARFMLPMFPVIFYFMAWGLSGMEERWAPALSLPEIPLAAAALAAALAGSRWIDSSGRTYEHDLSELTRAAHDDGALLGGGCVIFVDHTWAWSGGEMMLGAPVNPYDVASDKPLPDDARYCSYALALGGREDYFKRPGMERWELLRKDSHGQLLYKRR